MTPPHPKPPPLHHTPPCDSSIEHSKPASSKRVATKFVSWWRQLHKIHKYTFIAHICICTRTHTQTHTHADAHTWRTIPMRGLRNFLVMDGLLLFPSLQLQSSWAGTETGAGTQLHASRVRAGMQHGVFVAFGPRPAVLPRLTFETSLSMTMRMTVWQGQLILMAHSSIRIHVGAGQSESQELFYDPKC